MMKGLHEGGRPGILDGDVFYLFLGVLNPRGTQIYKFKILSVLECFIVCNVLLL